MRGLKLWNSLRGLAAVALAWALPFMLPAAAQAQTQAGWQRCAGHDEICRFQGPALVRYGVDGRYAYKAALHRIICDHIEFGDPAVGQLKQCDFNPDLNAQPKGSSDPLAWVPCASEGNTCSFSGNARVRYGVDQRWVYRNASNSLHCSVTVFGDPAYGTNKTCEYQLYGPVGDTSSTAGWDYCASEGGFCNFSGAAEVRYGTQGRYVSKRAINGTPCTVASFGSDPYYGKVKQCSVRAVRP